MDSTRTPASPRGSHRDQQHGEALVVRGLRLEGPQGPVFGPVDLTVPPGRHAAVLGPQGSGRSALLLALAGRMKGVTGEIRVGALDGARHPRRLRQRTAVARISDLATLERSLTVREACDEHALLEGLSTRAGRATYERLAAAVGFDVSSRAIVGELSAADRTVLTAILGCQRPAHHVVLDDVDEDLTLPQLERVYDALDVLGGYGHCFVVSALGSSPAPHGAVVVHVGEEPPASPLPHARHVLSEES